ncbi:MAG: carbon starvation protein A [Planctomycetia bacterium]|nr:carbon starvation protein A [Candidatus Brocadia sp.]QOJ07354.1 MAG: carbon starvation protein A [Planctomycetia bacterium]TVL98230.1 MAG: carbon starvation protein A [Candidatus Brocadia sp. BL1]HQU30389.1 carbon starvation protein A [Candidatus Brocadia sapporoensis]
MKVSTIIFVIPAVAGAYAMGAITQIFRPAEKVNAIWLILAAVCCFIVSYRFYAAFLATKVLNLDDNRIPPSRRLCDGRDYHPTHKWILFGHHFAAIAGAGPLIGPVLAAQFGYLPGFLWILIGASVGGAVHDTVILAASVRRNGKSLAQIARDEVGLVAGVTAAIAILFIIIVALAGLGLAVVNALSHSPWGTFTIAATIPIALFMGLYLYKIRYGKVAEVSIVGVIFLVLAIFFGRYIPGSPFEPYFNLDRNLIIGLMAFYGFAASVLPVWMLLCPRDYLSTYMKIGTILLLALGVIFLTPSIRMPAVTKFIHGGGPIIPGTLFPFMFITIACGAISGFHAIVSSGTTSKMIEYESEIKMIGFGAMLVEGFVSVIALIAATILIPGDYFAINTNLSFDVLAELGFPVDKIFQLSENVGVDVAGRPGGAVSLAVSMASLFSSLPGMKSLMPYWYTFALMFEALFILTTIDTGTRVARFILQELGSYAYKPLGKTSWIPGTVVSSLLVVGAWGYLIYTGSISTIWPMFGVANQLLAAIAFCVGTTIIIKMNKIKYVWITFLPMVFMFVTTFVASYQLLFVFLEKAASSNLPGDVFTCKLDAALIVIMAILAIIVLLDSFYKWYGCLIKKD